MRILVYKWKAYNYADILETFTELGSIYESAGGDDIYHDKLKPEVLALPIHDD